MASINGWYYDNQLNNRLTSVSLHSNKWFDETADNGEGKEKGKFEDWDKCKVSNGFGPNKGKTDDDKYATNAGGESTGRGSGYGIDPICKSILAEDFNVTISNSWSDFGGDPIAEVWNSARAKYAPYLKNITESLELLLQNNKETREQHGEELGKVAGFLSRILERGGDMMHGLKDKYDIDIVRFMNKALVTQGTRFSYYGGTGITFGNLGMKFTIFPKWDENNKFVSVTEQINKLYPYFIGRMEKFEEVESIISRTEGESIDLTNNYVYDFLKKCFMWQTPPNDYKSELFDVDEVQEGTLKLKLGGYYELSNLLCSDMMLTFSKSMVKNPEDNSISPLFCDVALNLRPSTKFTDLALRKFIGGIDKKTNGTNRSDLIDLNNKLLKNLENDEQNFKKNYLKYLKNYS